MHAVSAMPPPSCPRRARGLTLVEMMVVVVLIGIILAMATLSMGTAGPQAKMREEGRRLLRLLELARETAIFESRELALVMTDDGYRFQELRARQWRDISDDEVLRRRKLEDGVRLQLRIEGEDIGLAGDEEEALAPPRIFLLSSGETTPFRIRLEAGGGRRHYELSGSSLGRFQLRAVGEPG